MQHLTLTPIGVIHTPYKEKYHAPRQPGVDKETVIGTIELFAHKNFEQALEDLSGFEYIWILSWFHENVDWRPKVLPPRGGRTKRGVFATRSPHRPNPVGLSLCKLLEVKGRFLRVENPDLLDGTPILDIKPYIPYAESYPDAEIGWLEGIEKSDEAPFAIQISELAKEQADWLIREHDIHLLDRASTILSFDPFPHSYRRIMPYEKGGYVIALKSWRIMYDVHEKIVSIKKILSGYPSEVIALLDPSREPLHDQQAHVQFHSKWMNMKNEQ
ncbi:MAG: tRNA (N6-threonylcarbamoyladenosine(37)-N6)-methyltransferase TrmO [Bacteroidota bacterium]|nr:tRNA (N6-threonylcarbamoyladenosine(37)-N6)-methyltransferase TrmO [Bacteroidota bacterium]